MGLPTLIMQNGLDNISLLGSKIVSNSKFIFISANGYNIYNGLIVVYYNTIDIDNSENILANIHSIIESPEKLNSNFGLTASVNENYLAVGAISYNLYEGVVYIYKYIYNKWLYIQKIINKNKFHVSVFGDNIKITNNNQLIISDYSKLIYIYVLDNNNDEFIYKKSVNDNIKNDIRHLSITNDKYNNIIICNPSQNFYAFNLQDNSTTYFNIEFNNNCFYGSDVFLYEKMLFVSCSLYYPFTNIPYELNSKKEIYTINNVAFILSMYPVGNVITSLIMTKIIRKFVSL